MKYVLVGSLVVVLAGCGGVGGLNPDQMAACSDAWSVCMSHRTEGAEYRGGEFNVLPDEIPYDIPIGVDIGEIVRSAMQVARDANQQCVLILTEHTCEMRVE
ncbi:MAG: hypothetical protein OES09_00015 [Gammaproteobacteria bacterium]|nr:hypothetical protein [Gammaproteobacteria bacterium]